MINIFGINIIFDFFDDLGGHAAHDAVIRHVLGNHRSGSDDNVIADGYAGQDGAVCSDLDVVANGNRLSNAQMIAPSLGRQRMIDRNDAGARPDHAVVANVYRGNIQKNRYLQTVDILVII